MTLLDTVADLLARERVAHALIGATALAVAGVARSTFDVDLLTTDRRVLTDAFWAPLGSTTASVRVRRGDDDDPLAGVVRLEHDTDRPVDVIVGRHAWQGAVIERAVAQPAGPPVVRPADLVLLKLFAGGTQDLWDVRELLALPGSDAIAREVDALLAPFPRPMRELWTAVRS